MPTLFFGIVVLVLVLWGLNAYSKADPKYLAKVMRPAGGILAVAAAAFLFFRGHIEVAIPLGLTGLGPARAGGRSPRPAGFSARRRPRVRCRGCARRSSRWSSTTTAARCAARSSPGRHQGAALDALDLTTLLGLLAEFDADSRALLAAYLDRREPGWREHAQDGAAAGQDRAGAGAGRQDDRGGGLPDPWRAAGGGGCGDQRAHRALMKKLHPDQGGSTYLAAQINEAKEVLLRRQR